MSATSPVTPPPLLDEASGNAEGSDPTRDERLRIARELHDVVGSGLATINIHAAVAAHLLETEPQQAAAELAAIRAATADAMSEMRGILGRLRESGDDQLRPTPSSVDRLDRLASKTSAAGVPTRVSVVGTARQLPQEVDLAAFRIVQESLANVLRHAGPAHASVVVTYESRRLVIEITDDGAGPAAVKDPEHVSYGIVGMSERATALGGTLVASARPEGGFRVRAVLPLGPRP